MSNYQGLVIEAEDLLRQARHWQGVVRNSLIEEERAAKAKREECLRRISELSQQGHDMVGYDNNQKLMQISATAHDIQRL
jgi:hypothetical protein